MRKAFTLIELLVVIAIIAILAAILFPVFAQAKEAAKKSTAVSNVKQYGTGAQIYLADNDDQFPLAFSRRADGTWRWGTVHPAPSGSIATGWDAPEIINQVNSMYHMSLQPYIKNWQLMAMNGQSTVTLPGEVFSTTTGVRPVAVGMTMNGLLHTYSGTAIENPSIVPAFWSGTGNTAFNGRVGANPSLNCPGNTTCRFNPGGPADPAGPTTGNQSPFFGYSNFNPGWNVWTYGGAQGGGVVITRTDSSARFIRAGVVNGPRPLATFNSTADRDMYAQAFTNAPFGFSFWATNDGRCATITAANTSGATYACFFRPDRTE